MLETDGIRNVIFDLGEVLIHYRWHKMLQDYGLDPEEARRVGTEMFEEPRRIWHSYDLGATTEEVIAAFRDEFPEDADAIEWFIRHGEYMVVPRPRVWALVHELKERGKGIYLLSNYPDELFRKHTEYADFMADLDGMVISSELHAGKPDPVIYETLLARYGLTAWECLFLDDRKENIEGAERLGIRGRQVFSQEGLLEDLRCILDGRPLPHQFPDPVRAFPSGRERKIR